jgi:CheY-like chemotaxis protein
MKNLTVQTENVSRPRWMIVDDNQDFLSLLRAVVEEVAGADVQCFQSPRAALAAFTDAPGAVDFVITDLEMPGMSGVELGERLRKLSPSLKILLATGSDILTQEDVVQKGFCGLLHKPFLVAALRNALAVAGILETPAENRSKNISVLTAA